MQIGIKILHFLGIMIAGSVGLVLIFSVIVALVALGLSLVFVVTSTVVKVFGTEPDRGTEQTDKFWLAIISPFYMPSRARYENCHNWRGRLWLMSFKVVETIFFLPVVCVGTIYVLPGMFHFVVTH